MSVNKDFFQPNREFNYDFESAGRPESGWRDAARVPETLVPTHCSFCGVQCGMYLKVADGKVIGVESRDFPHNRGSLCPKGVVAYQQVNHPDRLHYPMIRRGGKGGKLERATWDEALDYIVSRWQRIQAEHGKDAIAVYSGSSMTNEKCYIMGKFARVGLGTRHIDYNGRLCMSSSAMAYARAFGIDRAPLPMTDIPLTDCMLAVGVNIAECFPIMMQWVWRARDKGASLIVIDPRETPLARTADLWLPVKPGTDIAVLNAMLRQIITDGLVDEEYVHARTTGWEQVRENVEPFTLEYAEHLSGVPAQRILKAARLYGRAATSLIMHARGIEHSTHGVDNCLACINLALARGQVGKPGGGTMMVTGQGNGQGGREVGQKANQLPGYRHIDVPEERQHIADFWGIPEEELPMEGAAATQMVHLMADGEIKSCLIVCSNLMVSLPDNKVVQRALNNLDPLIVIDFFLSETAELADVVLPGTVWCEDEGTTTNLEGRVIKINRAADPPGESWADWRIVRELAKRLGRSKFFPYESPLDIWNELRNASKGGMSDYYGITWEKIDEQGGVFWPCPELDHPGTPRLYTERFGHPDGKAKMFPIPYQPPAEEPGDMYPFRLTTGRVVYHYLSGNQTRRLGFLNSQAPEPWVEIHPQAAARLGIVNDEIVRVRTPRASMELKALVVPTIRPDTLFIPYHYAHEHAANQLTNPAVEPSVKIPEYKACAATVEKITKPAVSPELDGVTTNFTPEDAPKMFPYEVGETKNLQERKAKRYSSLWDEVAREPQSDGGERARWSASLQPVGRIREVAVKTLFVDPSRCIGCRACEAACRECDSHKGESMVMVDFINRSYSVATQPTVCMHCQDPLAPCAQVCPAMAILITPEGVVQQAEPSRCIGCRNCVYACPFGVPKFDVEARLMKKCNLCYDRTSQGLKPWCAQACPTQALWYGDYEEFMNQRQGHPVNFTAFGEQTVRTRVFHVLPQETPRLDLVALLDQARARTGHEDEADQTREEAWVL